MVKQMENINFRRARLSDIEQLMPLLIELYHGDVSPGLIDIVKQFIQNGECYQLIVEANSQVIAFFLGTHRLEIDFECRAAIIEEVVVQKKYQSKGIGKKMLDSFMQWAREKGCKGILVPCGRKGFYEKMGFERYDVKRYWKWL